MGACTSTLFLVLSCELRKPIEDWQPTILSREIEYAKLLHPVGRDGVLLVYNSDVPKAKRFEDRPNDLVMPERPVRFGRRRVGTSANSSWPNVRPQ